MRATMGYDLHITRAMHRHGSEKEPILLQDWLDSAEEDPGAGACHRSSMGPPRPVGLCLSVLARQVLLDPPEHGGHLEAVVHF